MATTMETALDCRDRLDATIAGLDREIDAAHGPQQPRPDRNFDAQPFDRKQRHHVRLSGASTSRKPSPRRLMPSTKMSNAKPGITITQAWKNM